VKGLFRGSVPALLKTPISSAVVFAVNEECRRLFAALDGDSKPAT
jgi:hypothetical protein